jgi:hypothetical protein
MLTPKEQYKFSYSVERIARQGYQAVPKGMLKVLDKFPESVSSRAQLSVQYTEEQYDPDNRPSMSKRARKFWALEDAFGEESGE